MEYPYYVVHVNEKHYGSYQTKRGAKNVFGRISNEFATGKRPKVTFYDVAWYEVPNKDSYYDTKDK
jgi:hypothetical protein